MRSIVRLTMACGVAIAVSGCVASVDAMIPAAPAGNHRHMNESLTVANVATTTESGYYDAPVVSSEAFKVALKRTLENSNLFASVKGSNADLTLYATIKGQSYDESIGKGHRTSIVVEYRIVQASSKKAVWDETYESQAGSTTFGTRGLMHSQEDSVRQNLAAFVQGISDGWGK